MKQNKVKHQNSSDEKFICNINGKPCEALKEQEDCCTNCYVFEIWAIGDEW